MNIREQWQRDFDDGMGRAIVMGTVTSTSPLQVQVDGEASSRTVNRLSGYTATLSDRVLMVRVGAGKFVIQGKVV